MVSGKTKEVDRRIRGTQYKIEKTIIKKGRNVLKKKKLYD